MRAVVADRTFQDGVLRIIALGGDTDTNAAVAGALLGARDGASALPEDWVQKLEDGDQIQREAQALVSLAGIET